MEAKQKKSEIELLKEALPDFIYVRHLYFLVFVPSFAEVLLSFPFPWITTMLSASRATPWGIVTGIFVHGDFLTHFLPNMAYLLAFCLLFVMSNFYHAKDTRERRSRFMFYIVLTTSVTINIVWTYLTPRPSIGASGAVFATEGAVLRFSSFNILPTGKTVAEVKQQYFTWRSGLFVFYNFLAFVFFVSMIFYNPAMFLGVGENVNSVEHGIGFLIALIGTILYEYIGVIHRRTRDRKQ